MAEEIDLTADEEQCPVCSAWVPVAELQAHCEAHFAAEEEAVAAAGGGALPLAASAADRVTCPQCALSIALADFDSHMVAHDLERGDLEAAQLQLAVAEDEQQLASPEVRSCCAACPLAAS